LTEPEAVSNEAGGNISRETLQKISGVNWDVGRRVKGALGKIFWVTLCKKLGGEDFIPHQFDEGERREEIFSFFRKTFEKKRARNGWRN